MHADDRTMAEPSPQRPWIRVAGRIVVSAVVVLGTLVATADARPRAALVVPEATSANRPLTATVTASGVERSARFLIQRRTAASLSWITVASVRAPSGPIRLPGTTLGAYDYRLAAIGAHGRLLSAQIRHVFVFGQVPFSTLFSLGGGSVHTGVRGAVIGGNGDTGPGVATTPTQTFPYVFGGVAGTGNPFVSVTNNSCRSASLQIVIGAVSPTTEAEQRNLSQSATISVIQSTHGPTTTRLGFNQAGSLAVALTPGSPWSIDTERSDPSEDGFYVYVNGSAECYSAAPFVNAG
jgi:hypothetical protein